MRRVLLLAVLGLALEASPGCMVVREPTGVALRPSPWHLRDGTYRPWDDVNSGSLPRRRWYSSLYSDALQTRLVPY